MLKLLISAVFLVVTLTMQVHEARAGELAASIFNSLGGTTTIDRGGAIHSQARSIFSGGGGMVSFHGKRVSLMAADAPSFRAGCSGISWHFGGFSFISMDELRQMVEAIAQASLGIAVDLAMQTLCPQCYAVMSKLREIANQMRNQSADACRVAKGFGDLAKSFLPASLQPDAEKQKCGYYQTEANVTSDSIQAQTGNWACSTLSKISDSLGAAQDAVDKYTSGTSTAKPKAEDFALVGNTTYTMLGALGYPDGLAKDILMSIMGMDVYVAQGESCAGPYANVGGVDAVHDLDWATGILPEYDATSKTFGQGKEITTAGATASSVATDGKATGADPTGSNSGSRLCAFPPLMTDLRDAAFFLICGPRYKTDAANFETRYNVSSAHNGLELMCNTEMAINKGVGTVGVAKANALDNHDPYIWHCEGQCTRPQRMRMTQAEFRLPSTAGAPVYSGLGLTILDALYQGVDAVRSGKSKLPDVTVAVLSRADLPLYRMINIAAVYPGLTDDLLNSLSALVALQYVTDTLHKVTALGTSAQIKGSGLRAHEMKAQDLQNLKQSIWALESRTQPVVDEMYKRLSQRQALSTHLQQVNKALTAEVFSAGLGDNNRMATTLKNAMSVKKQPVSGGAGAGGTP